MFILHHLTGGALFIVQQAASMTQQLQPFSTRAMFISFNDLVGKAMLQVVVLRAVTSLKA